MKFTALFPFALLVATVVAQEAYDSTEFAARELDEEIALSARTVHDDLVLRALHHVKQQAQDHADLVARTYDLLDNALYRRWGSGKYVIEDNIYHRDVKPKILTHMAKINNFKGKCGTNPDFMVERKGDVYPSATKKNSRCTKKEFTINMSEMPDVEAYFISKSRSPSPEPQSTKSGHKKLRRSVARYV